MAKTQVQDRRAAMLSDGEPEKSTTERVKMAAGLLVIALLILFLVENSFHSAEIWFLWFSWHITVAWALLGAAIGGALTMIAAQWFRRRAASRRISA